MERISILIELVMKESKELNMKLNIEYTGSDIRFVFFKNGFAASRCFNISHEIMGVSSMDPIHEQLILTMHKVNEASIRGGF